MEAREEQRKFNRLTAQEQAKYRVKAPKGKQTSWRFLRPRVSRRPHQRLTAAPPSSSPLARPLLGRAHEPPRRGPRSREESLHLSVRSKLADRNPVTGAQRMPQPGVGATTLAVRSTRPRTGQRPGAHGLMHACSILASARARRAPCPGRTPRRRQPGRGSAGSHR